MTRRLPALSALGLCTALSTGPITAASPPASDPGPYLHAQRLVDVGGGRRMNLYCTGTGSPTVVLGTDGDDGTPAWRFVQPVLAQRTRVCSYDGEGLGFSDPVKPPLDAASAVTDLHTMLAHAGVRSPLVMVGYSLSGLYARLYADRYPGEVAGMVLVSPNVPDESKRLGAIVPALARSPASAAAFDRCAASAERGEMRPGTRAFASCMYTPPDPTMPQALKDLVRRQWQSAGLWRDVVSAMDSEAASSAQVTHEQRSYDDMPLVVLTTTKDIALLPIPKQQKTTLARAWIGWHKDIAKLSRRGIDLVVEGSTMSIPIDRPTAVVSAISEVVDQARNRKQ